MHLELKWLRLSWLNIVWEISKELRGGIERYHNRQLTISSNALRKWKDLNKVLVEYLITGILFKEQTPLLYATLELFDLLTRVFTEVNTNDFDQTFLVDISDDYCIDFGLLVFDIGNTVCYDVQDVFVIRDTHFTHLALVSGFLVAVENGFE